MPLGQEHRTSVEDDADDWGELAVRDTPDTVDAFASTGLRDAGSDCRRIRRALDHAGLATEWGQ